MVDGLGRSAHASLSLSLSLSLFLSRSRALSLSLFLSLALALALALAHSLFSLARSLSLSAGTFAVQLTAPAGELVAPLCLSEAEFDTLAKGLKGMHEAKQVPLLTHVQLNL